MVHFGVTRHPTDAWVAQQLREAMPNGQAPRFLIRDNDSKFGQDFSFVARCTSIQVLRTPHRAPRTNAVCERFLGSVRRECLDYLLIVSEPLLYRVVKEYVTFFDAARPHQGLGQQIPEQWGSRSGEQRDGKIVAFPVLTACITITDGQPEDRAL